jgi:hypothetical protein
MSKLPLPMLCYRIEGMNKRKKSICYTIVAGRCLCSTTLFRAEARVTGAATRHRHRVTTPQGGCLMPPCAPQSLRLRGREREREERKGSWREQLERGRRLIWRFFSALLAVAGRSHLLSERKRERQQGEKEGGRRVDTEAS